jgi:hypothetical protein
MLGATQKQLYTMGPTPGKAATYDAEGNLLTAEVPGGTEITGFQPYKSFGGTYDDKGKQIGYDAGKSIAGFSPAQQQAQQGIMGLQVPGQYGAATNLTNQAAAGSMGAVGQAGNLQNQALGYGSAGAQYGGAGAQYGSAGAEQAQRAAALTAAQAGMYGAQGAQAGQQAAGLSNLYGGMGSQAGQQYAGLSGAAGAQGAGIGQNLGRMSTDPNAVQSYMNPYIQASLNPQLAEIQRQYDITGTQQQSGATKSGAFGGSREALMAAENQRNAGLAKNQLIGQGYNQAFQQAQQQMNAANQAALAGNQQALSGYGQAGSQAMQGYGMGLQGAGQAGSQAMQGYGMGLQGVGAQQAAGQLGLAGTAQGMQGAQAGMQGAQAGMQGVQGALGAGQYGLAGLGQAGQMAGQLAGIGGQQLAAQQGIYNAQNQIGGQQQQLEQQKINQAIQDYANAQQYPIMQLGTMSNMLRGLPMQAQTTQQYQAQANPITQGIGALGAGASLYNAVKAKGGVVKAAKGGIMSYDVGGAVYSDLLEMEPEQLSKYIKEASSPRVKSMAEQVLREKTGKASGGIMRFARGEDVELGEEYKPGEKVEGSISYAKPPVSGKSPYSRTLETQKQENLASAENLIKRGADINQQGSAFGRELAAQEKLRNETINKQGPSSGIFGVFKDQTDAEKANAEKEVANAQRLKAIEIKNNPTTSTTQPYVLSDAEKAQEATYFGGAPAIKGPPKPTEAPPDKNLRIPPDRVNTIVNQNPQLKDAMGGNTPDKNAKETLGIYKDLLKELKVEDLKPTDEYAGKTTAQIANKLEAERAQFLGKNPSGDQRKQIMSERANAEDEAKRTQAMRMAEFFAMWGSTPGNTIVAGLNAMKNKIPDLIADRKDATKIRRDIDKSIAELDRVDYLEKSGRFDEAGKLRETSRKHGIEWATKMVDLSSKVAIATAQDISAEKRAHITGKYGLEGDKLRAAAISEGNRNKINQERKLAETQYARANTTHETARKNLYKELADDTVYTAQTQILANPKLSEDAKKEARKYVADKDKKIAEVLRPLQEDRDYYRMQRDSYGPNKGAAPETSTSKETVNVGGVTYSKPPNMTADDWAKYKKDVGIK